MNLSMYTVEDPKRLQDIESAHGLSDDSHYRSDYRRDISRLLHAPSFRRLQGKTQLFPGHESDFFRNRLSHSLEVAQIAESIGYKLNADIKDMGERYASCLINTDILRFAGLAHDLGHPPFGHLGEQVLNCQMANSGGFEGNAQTLHILTKLEKVVTKNYKWDNIDNNNDERAGLNLTYRSLASILKYDNPIQIDPTPSKKVKHHIKTLHPEKGYYKSEIEIVKRIKEHVAPGFEGKFKSVECAIMDVADDIAYSTYDLEDALKAGFISPLSIIGTPDSKWVLIVDEVNKNLLKEHKSLGTTGAAPTITVQEAFDFVKEIFQEYLVGSTAIDKDLDAFVFLKDAHAASSLLKGDGEIRTGLTSYLVGIFVRSVRIEVNEDYPALSKVYLEDKERKRVEILKQLTWQYQILDHKLKIVARRGVEIVNSLFEMLSADSGYELLPKDFRTVYNSCTDKLLRKRIICDFIAGMTDRYAIEFYGRLKSMHPETIFKPL